MMTWIHGSIVYRDQVVEVAQHKGKWSARIRLNGVDIVTTDQYEDRQLAERALVNTIHAFTKMESSS